MKTLFIVEAYGGKYEDYWTANVRAFHSNIEAEQYIDYLESTLEILQKIELPESCLGNDIDWEVDDQCRQVQADIDEFWLGVVTDMAIPEHDRAWLLAYKDYTHTDSISGYMIKPLELAEPFVE